MNRSVSETRSTPARLWQLLGPWPAIVLALLCYANTLFNGFTYDDNAIVRENVRIRSLANLPEIWLTDYWYEKSADQPIADPVRDRLYRPLTLQSFALNYAVHGDHAFGYHLVNVLGHALVCWLVWLFAWRLLGNAAVAGITAILFAVHPIHSEAVAGIVGRGELLGTGFVLAGLLCLMPRSGNPAGWQRGLLAAVAFLAAIFSKETIICYPAVALITLYAVNRARRRPWRWWLMHLGFLCAPLVVYFPLRLYALEGLLLRKKLASVLYNPLMEADWLQRLYGPLTILGHYARLLIAPRNLSCDYGLAIFDPGAGPTLMTAVGVVAVVVLLVALAGFFSRAVLWKNMAVLAALFCASYALISNTVLLIGVSVAERLMYWPSVLVLGAIAALIVHGWERYCTKGRPLGERAGLLRVFGILLIVALGARSVTRNADWIDDEHLFRADLATHPNGVHLCNSLARIDIYHAHHCMGTAVELVAQGQQEAAAQFQREAAQYLDEAETLLKRALAIRSHFPEALCQLGSVLWMRGETEQAQSYFETALRLDPGDSAAQRYLAALRGEDKQLQEQAAVLRQQIQKQPDEPDAYVQLGELLVTLGQRQEALLLCEQAAKRFPDNVAVLRAHAETLALNQFEDEACAAYEHLLARDASDWKTHANLSILLAPRDPATALEHAEIACRLHPDDVRTQVNLAEVLVLNGRTQDAINRLRAVENATPADDPFRQVIRGRREELENR